MFVPSSNADVAVALAVAAVILRRYVRVGSADRPSADVERSIHLVVVRMNRFGSFDVGN